MLEHQFVGLSYTVTCPLACRHCVTESSPRARGRMRFEQARRYLVILPRFTSSTCFTGGEPLLYHREIVEHTRFARELGLSVSVLTGAGWVAQEDQAARKVRELADAGLVEMGISWDAYHEEFSARGHAVLLARLAADAGLRVVIRTTLPAGADDAVYREAFRDIPVYFVPAHLTRLGRATSLAPDEFRRYDEPPHKPCNAVMSTVIAHDGKVYACCGPAYFSAPHSPLVLGNAEEEPLEEILERATHDSLLEVIALLGPYGLYLLLKQSHAAALYNLRDSYTSICELCMDLTDTPEIVTALREEMGRRDTQVLLAAARMWTEHRLKPDLREGRARWSNASEADDRELNFNRGD